MRQTTEHIKILLFAAALSAVGGCTERELSERPADGPLIVHLEWPEGAGGDDATVDGAHLLLYRSDGSLHQRIECEAEGHECRVPADTYTILAVNSDRANTSYANHESHQQCRLLADGHPTEEGVLMHVGNVYSTGLQGVEVRPGNAATEVTLRFQEANLKLTRRRKSSGRTMQPLPSAFSSWSFVGSVRASAFSKERGHISTMARAASGSLARMISSNSMLSVAVAKYSFSTWFSSNVTRTSFTNSSTDTRFIASFS